MGQHVGELSRNSEPAYRCPTGSEQERKLGYIAWAEFQGRSRKGVAKLEAMGKEEKSRHIEKGAVNMLWVKESGFIMCAKD